MLVKTLAILATAAAVAADCGVETTSYDHLGRGHPVSRPDVNNKITPGVSGDIIWLAKDPAGDVWGDFVNIYLLQGPGGNIKEYAPIAMGVPNSGSYSWTPSCDDPNFTPCEDGWGILVQDSVLCTFQYTSQFGILPSQCGTTPPVGGSSTSSVVVAPPTTTSPATMPTWTPPSNGTTPPKGGPYGNPKGDNCTSTSTVWVNPTGGSTPPKASYTPIHGNSGAKFGLSLVGVAAAVAAFFL